MATMANFFHKYGHNMATFSMSFDPIFSFYCIFVWQFSNKIQIGERNLEKLLEKLQNKNGPFIAFLSNDILENFKISFQKIFF